MKFRYTMRCTQCGIEFGARRKTARFCSTSCRVKWNRINNYTVTTSIDKSTLARMTKSLRVKIVTCPMCNANFGIDGNHGNRIYCSNSCKQRAYRTAKDLRCYGIVTRKDSRK